ncbi:MAG TPA: hypothetical protein VHF89_07780 [Solirubrobacteraceae bacterium]|nr:hypothetical protein [Solirubrobacteraceae bacterium]
MSLYVPPPSPERALTRAQRQALLAIHRAAEVGTAAVAEAAGMRPNGAGLALRGLQRRGLVARHDGDPATWAVTFAGRALAERLEARP